MARRPDLSRPHVRRPRNPSEPEKRRPVAANGLAAAIGTHSASEYREVAERYGIFTGPGFLDRTDGTRVMRAGGFDVTRDLSRREDAVAIAALPDILIDRDRLVRLCEPLVDGMFRNHIDHAETVFELRELLEKIRKSMPT